MAEQKEKLDFLLDKLVQVKISFENLDQVKTKKKTKKQNKTKKFWCDQHQYNPFHETKDCNFLDKSNKSWCDQHRYNTTHETKDCNFLNKNKKTKEIKQAVVTDDCSDDEFYSADDS